MADMKETYIILCVNSEGALSIRKAFGTREEIQNYLADDVIAIDFACDRDHYLNGTIGADELEYVGEGNGMYGYSNFDGYSVHYYAYPYTDIPMIEED